MEKKGRAGAETAQKGTSKKNDYEATFRRGSRVERAD